MSHSQAACLFLPHWPQPLSTSDDKKYHLTYFTFPLLSAVVQPWSSHLSEYKEKWKQGYVVSPCMSGCSRTTISAWSEMVSMALKLKCSLKTNQYFDYGSVTFNVFSQKQLLHQLAAETSNCWIFLWAWLLNHRGDCGKAPCRCQTPEAMVQPTVSLTFCKIFLCMWYMVHV